MSTRLFLCTDLDRTLLPNGTQPESPGARALFARLVTRPEVVVAYVTGRHRALAETAITNYSLPRPDFVVTDVGTRIHTLDDRGWRALVEWEAEIAPDWAGLDHAAIRDLLHDLPALRLQERARQNTHKLSYYVPLAADRIALDVAIRARLEARGVRASLVWSIDEPAGIGLLDVIPARATKLHAIEFLQVALGYAKDETVYAGDSGNDLPVLASAVPAVLVANAGREVREAALAQARAAGTEDALYFARGGFEGMNGNYSAGILEGVVHFMPQARAWLNEGVTP